MNEIEQEFMKQLGPDYDHSAKPTVYFFDYAVKVSDGDRPRFKNAVYISKRSKTAHENQDFHRKMEEEDKAEFPAEWAHYERVKENLKKPSVSLLPGIDEATKHEMQAIGIYNLEQLVAQDDFVEWLELARRILDVTGKVCKQERQAVQGDDNQQTDGVLGADWGSYSTRQNWQQESKEKSYQEKSVKKENVTFDFDMKVA